MNCRALPPGRVGKQLDHSSCLFRGECSGTLTDVFEELGGVYQPLWSPSGHERCDWLLNKTLNHFMFSLTSPDLSQCCISDALKLDLQLLPQVKPPKRIA